MVRFLVLALLGCASMQHPRPVTPGTIPELDYFVGRWQAEARNPTTGQTFAMEYSITPVLGGRWYEGNGRAPALGLELRDLWGKDAVTGEIVRTIFDSQQTFGTVRSSG